MCIVTRSVLIYTVRRWTGSTAAGPSGPTSSRGNVPGHYGRNRQAFPPPPQYGDGRERLALGINEVGRGGTIVGGL